MNKLIPNITFICVLLGLFISAVSASATLKLGTPFTENMVVQHDKTLTVWGWDEPSQTVNINFDGESASTVAASDGRWELQLETPDPGGPYKFEVSGSQTVTFNNVLSGEVWLASGQSNMGWPLSKTWKAAERIQNANYPDIRFMKMRLVSENLPQEDVVVGDWFAISSKTAGDVSGVAYFFAQRLHNELDMPIGIIQSAWGGSKIQAWIPDDVLKEFGNYDHMWKTYLERKEAYYEKLKVWEANDKQGQKPRWEGGGPQHMPSGLDNAMIHPLQPYPIKGVIWYQGESDSWNPDGYRRQFRMLVETWRDRFNDPDLPVYFCQLPDFKNNWTQFRLAQAKIPSELPNTDYAVLIGAGQYDDIHPKNKITPGTRLAQLALAHDYGFDIVPGGPFPIDAKQDGNTIEVDFDRTGKGLELKPNDKGETLIVLYAGEERVMPSSVRVADTDTIVIDIPDSAPAITEVRYATFANPKPTLFNKDGFPATPFLLKVK